ncbi:MAG: hypothetical protein HEP71_34000 [Roseivirga sp.]|nr:hypothetical protein [Roseivirga sp.]
MDEGEQIILFDSNGYGLAPQEVSGNFFTNKRIASYWIDEHKQEDTYVESAYYSEIDTIWRYPKFNAWTIASYLEVYRTDGSTFKVYVDGDSTDTWNFFNLALRTWNENKAR